MRGRTVDATLYIYPEKYVKGKHCVAETMLYEDLHFLCLPCFAGCLVPSILFDEESEAAQASIYGGKIRKKGRAHYQEGSCVYIRLRCPSSEKGLYLRLRWSFLVIVTTQLPEPGRWCFSEIPFSPQGIVTPWLFGASASPPMQGVRSARMPGGNQVARRARAIDSATWCILL